MLLLWFKAFHLIFMVSWFAGIFYLPRLFVYHSLSTDPISIARFKIMERKLFYGIMLPGAIFTLFFGIGMIVLAPHLYLPMRWLHFKFAFILLLIIYHIYLGKLLYVFKYDRNKHSHVYYRILNEIPVIFLVAIILLAVLKPF